MDCRNENLWLRLLAFQRQTFMVPEVSHCGALTTGSEGTFPSAATSQVGNDSGLAMVATSAESIEEV